MIPKVITTFWFNEHGHIPDNILKCISSQQKFAAENGYQHRLISLKNIQKPYLDCNYVQQCLNSPHEGKKWVKLTDYLRMRYLFDYGGIAMDADVEILPNADLAPLQHEDRVILCDEGTATIPGTVVLGSAVVMAPKSHQLIRWWITQVDINFRGDDELCYESSMDILNKLAVNNLDIVKILPPEYFYPYNHFTGKTNITKNSLFVHHFGKSWVNNVSTNIPAKAPSIDIIIPHVAGIREDGLARVLRSINRSTYKGDISIHIILGDDTVPKKIDRAVKATSGELICYLADDTEIVPTTLGTAALEMFHKNMDLVSFPSGNLLADAGNICEHFIIRRSALEYLDGGMIFHTDFRHVGCDNYLWLQVNSRGKAFCSPLCKIQHHHAASGRGVSDDLTRRAWDVASVAIDRETLERKTREYENRHQSKNS